MTAAAASAYPLSIAHAQSLYWGSGAGGAWSTAANWYTDAGETSVSGSAPTASNDVIFNTTPDNALGGTITFGTVLNYANSLTFNTSGATILSQNNAGRNLVLGGGGITVNSGAGNVNIGTSSNVLRAQIAQNQTWTNHAASTLNVRVASASEFASGPVVLTMNAAGTGNITASLGYTDSNYTNSTNSNNSLGIVVDSAGSGAVSLVTSTYTGGTTVKRGTLNTNGTLGTGTVLVGDTTGSAAATFGVTATTTFTNDIIVQAGSSGVKTISASNNPTFSGNITLNDNVTINAAGNPILTGTVSGTGAITKTGSGALTLSGNNTFSGGVSVTTNSALRINNGGTSSTNSAIGTGTLSSTGSFTLDNTSGSAVTLATNNAVVLNGSLTFTGTNDLNLGTGAFSLGTATGTTRTISTTASTLTIGGVISDGTTAKGIIKQGAGTLSLRGDNTYTGITQIGSSGVGGTLEVTHLADGGQASSVGASSSAAPNLVFGGSGTAATLRYVGTGDSTNRSFGVGSVGAQFDASGTGAVNWTNTAAPNLVGSNTARTVTFKGTSTHANTMSAGFTNNGTGATSIVKTESGRWILAGNNTYTGTTTVSGGTLGLSGSIANSATTVQDTATLALMGGTAGSVTIDSGAFLTGSGTVGSTTVNGTLAIGNSPGTLTLSNGASLALGSGSVSDFEFTSSGFEIGSFDRVVGTAGGLAETATLGGTLNLIFTGSGYTAGTDVAQLFSLDSITGTFSSINVTGLDGFGLEAIFDSSTGYLSLVSSTIPEPSAFAAFAGLGALALVAARRRRAV